MKGLHYTVVLQGGKLTTLTPSSSSSSSSFASFDPSSVLDTTRSPSPPTSSSTSLGGGARYTSVAGGGEPPHEWSHQQHQDTSSGGSNVDIDHHPAFYPNEEWCSDSAIEAAAAAPPPPTKPGGGGGGGGGMGVEDWFTSLPEAAPSPGSEQSILRLIMGEAEEDVNKLFQIEAPPPPPPDHLDFNGGYGVWDQGFVQHQQDLLLAPPSMAAPPPAHNNSVLSPYLLPASFLPPTTPLHFHQFEAPMEEKPRQVFNPRPVLGDNQSSYFFLPMQSEELLFSSPQVAGAAAAASRAGKRQQMLAAQGEQHRGAAARVKRMVEEGGQSQEVQQAVMEHLYQAAEMVEMGNPEVAKGILARLNHQLSPSGRPFQRAAFYFKEALLRKETKFISTEEETAAASFSTNHQNSSSSSSSSSPVSLLYKIGAYKSFSEVSPILHFAHFTCMQALLEALHGHHQIHILDFDIGYGGQWASLMQELALRNNGGGPSLKITAFVSGATHSELELGITRDNLQHFAAEVGLRFVFQAVSVESLSRLWPAPVEVSDGEAVAVNLQVGCAPVPVVLRLVKQVGARIVVCVDRGQERWDMSFAQHLIYSLQLQWAVLESLEAMSVNVEAVQKIERFLVNPEIERMVSGRRRFGFQEKGVAPWRSLFLSSGFSPMPISNFNESQAACVVKRSPVHGFHVEKRHSSLVLCWQTKELLSASAWSCY